jgi:sulfide:quinone oxidoreductase
MLNPYQEFYPFPFVGPFPLLKESWLNYIGKLSFNWIYWNIMLRGIPFPLPPSLLYCREETNRIYLK